MVRKGELENRLDSLFYIERIDYSKFIKLSKIAKIAGGKRLPLGHEFSSVSTKYRYLRVGDIDWNGNLDYQNFNYLAEETYQALSRYEIFDNELLIAIVGATIGKVALLKNNSDENIILTENCAKISIKNPHVLPQYLLAVLQSRLVQKQIQLNYIQTTLPKLGLERLEALKIPVPPDLHIQTKITDLLNVAHLSKSQKEAEAAAFLASIDGYLLQALGITLPPASAPKKCFYTRASKVRGGRFDALSHQTDVFSEFKTGRYSLVAIKEIAHYIKTGFAAGKQDQDMENSGVIQIRPTNIKEPERDFNFDKNVYIKISEIKKRPADLLQQGEVLFNNTNSQELVGKTTLFDLEGNYFCSNHMTRIGVNNKVTPSYLTLILNLYQHKGVFYRTCVNWNNQSGVNVEMLKNIVIPLPPLEIQTEIANHINQIRAQAKQLQQEAQAEMEAAKQQVEKMILGEA